MKDYVNDVLNKLNGKKNLENINHYPTLENVIIVIKRQCRERIMCIVVSVRVRKKCVLNVYNQGILLDLLMKKNSRNRRKRFRKYD